MAYFETNKTLFANIGALSTKSIETKNVDVLVKQNVHFKVYAFWYKIKNSIIYANFSRVCFSENV
jgi:hypothetical protein